MGFFDDVRGLLRSSKTVAEASGRPTGMADRVAALPADLARSREMAEFAAAQSVPYTPQPVPGSVPLPGVLVSWKGTGRLMHYLPEFELTAEAEVEPGQVEEVTVLQIVDHASLVYFTHRRAVTVWAVPGDLSTAFVDVTRAGPTAAG